MANHTIWTMSLHKYFVIFINLALSLISVSFSWAVYQPLNVSANTYSTNYFRYFQYLWKQRRSIRTLTRQQRPQRDSCIALASWQSMYNTGCVHAAFYYLVACSALMLRPDLSPRTCLALPDLTCRHGNACAKRLVALWRWSGWEADSKKTCQWMGERMMNDDAESKCQPWRRSEMPLSIFDGIDAIIFFISRSVWKLKIKEEEIDPMHVCSCIFCGIISPARWSSIY